MQMREDRAYKERPGLRKGIVKAGSTKKECLELKKCKLRIVWEPMIEEGTDGGMIRWDQTNQSAWQSE